MRRAVVLLLALLAICAPAFAQEQDVQRALIQRDQQSAEFALRLRQSQEAAKPAPGDNRHLNERQKMEKLSERQLQSVQNGTPQELRPYERQRAADERTLALPPPKLQARDP